MPYADEGKEFLDYCPDPKSNKTFNSTECPVREVCREAGGDNSKTPVTPERDTKAATNNSNTVPEPPFEGASGSNGGGGGGGEERKGGRKKEPDDYFEPPLIDEENQEASETENKDRNPHLQEDDRIARRSILDFDRLKTDLTRTELQPSLLRKEEHGACSDDDRQEKNARKLLDSVHQLEIVKQSLNLHNTPSTSSQHSIFQRLTNEPTTRVTSPPVLPTTGSSTLGVASQPGTSGASAQEKALGGQVQKELKKLTEENDQTRTSIPPRPSTFHHIDLNDENKERSVLRTTIPPSMSRYNANGRNGTTTPVEPAEHEHSTPVEPSPPSVPQTRRVNAIQPSTNQSNLQSPARAIQTACRQSRTEETLVWNPRQDEFRYLRRLHRQLSHDLATENQQGIFSSNQLVSTDRDQWNLDRGTRRESPHLQNRCDRVEEQQRFRENPRERCARCRYPVGTSHICWFPLPQRATGDINRVQERAFLDDPSDIPPDDYAYDDIYEE